jgi:hypothetical protein
MAAARRLAKVIKGKEDAAIQKSIEKTSLMTNM